MRAVILDNLRSAHNVGSVMRTVSALNYDSVALCGVTITPPSDKLKKTSRGLDDSVNWNYFKTTTDAINHFKTQGFKIFALDTAPNSIEITKLSNFPKCAWVIGNEALGIDSEVLKLCDNIFHLPMLNAMSGINVSCAFSAMAYHDYLKFYNER